MNLDVETSQIGIELHLAVIDQRRLLGKGYRCENQGADDAIVAIDRVRPDFAGLNDQILGDSGRQRKYPSLAGRVCAGPIAPAARPSFA